MRDWATKHRKSKARGIGGQELIDEVIDMAARFLELIEKPFWVAEQETEESFYGQVCHETAIHKDRAIYEGGIWADEMRRTELDNLL
jgi:hypothetical protein